MNYGISLCLGSVEGTEFTLATLSRKDCVTRYSVAAEILQSRLKAEILGAALRTPQPYPLSEGASATSERKLRNQEAAVSSAGSRALSLRCA